MTTILVIDDNPDVGEALELLFSLHGIDVSYVNSPEAGLARLDNKQPGRTDRPGHPGYELLGPTPPPARKEPNCSARSASAVRGCRSSC